MNEIHVVIGILRNSQGQVLIALRPPGVEQPGVWEFPGGKVESGESKETALIREYHEEIGIKVQQFHFLFSIEGVTVTQKKLQLHVFDITAYQGTPSGMENQLIRFVPVEALTEYTFPDANREIVAWLTSI